jgi:hypothetical protein
MDWNWVMDDAKFYGIEVAELLAYVLLVAAVAVAIEAIVDRIRGKKATPTAASQRTPERTSDGRPVHGH